MASLLVVKPVTSMTAKWGQIDNSPRLSYPNVKLLLETQETFVI
jgi:hypothetical protein